MDKEKLKQALPTFDDYLGVDLPGLTELESNFVCLHNSGDSKRIQSKMWARKELSEGEQLFVDGLIKALDKLESANGQSIIIYEINITDFELKELRNELKYCKENEVLFSNKAFWNFSAHDWEFEHFRIEIRTKRKSKAKLIYKLFGETGKSESEITYIPNCFFRVLEIDNHSVLIEEVE